MNLYEVSESRIAATSASSWSMLESKFSIFIFVIMFVDEFTPAFSFFSSVYCFSISRFIF